MNDPNDLYNAGTSAGIVPEGDAARQAVDSLRGYAYQVLAATLAWLDVDEDGRLFLEVAEDYATVARQALDTVQVKDTKGSVTLNNEDIRNAVATFVDLVERNPDIRVELRYFTTSEIGREQAIADRPAGMAGLKYWRKVAAGEDPKPLRSILESDKFPESVRYFARVRNDAELRRDLIQKIRWDCGMPDFSTLRQELEERLIVVGRDRFNLQSADSRRLAEPLMYKVLNKCIAKSPQDRVLTRGDLYSEIDALTQISVPRRFVDTIFGLDSGLIKLLSKRFDLGGSLSLKETDWLIDGTTLPVRHDMVPRVALESAVADALRNFGAGVITGSSGLGKSNVSRAAVVAHSGAFHMVEFRDIGANETRHLLDMVFARIGGLRSSALILDDLNHIDDKQVASSIARVVEASRRYNRAVIITCHRRPSLATLASIGLNQGCVVECVYFSEKEVSKLIISNGGDPNRWGRVAYIAGFAGHPQLTHAFVIGMAARGWPAEVLRDVVNRGLSSDEIDATRDEVRRSLVSRLPEETRNLLYRLSLTIGRFNRSTALSIGEICPQLSQVGESVDQLIGPWIEPLGQGLFRVSPLTSSIGREMLSPVVQQTIHKTLAVEMLRKRTIDARDADTILAHATLGKSPESLFALAQGVLSADPSNVEMLAERFLLLRFSRADVPIFAEDPGVSGILRLAQFKLAAAGERHEASDIAAALFREIGHLPKGEPKHAFEAMAVITVLGTMGVANLLDNWVTLLNRFKKLERANPFLQDIIARTTAEVPGSNFFGALFRIGIARLDSVERLEYVINELDKIDASERMLWLNAIDETISNYSLFINEPWASEQRRKDFDATDVAIRYQRMAETTRKWGIRALTLQCSVAQAVILDEYQNNKDCAVAVLDEAAADPGNHQILRRALANIHWRHGDYRNAFEIYRCITDQIDRIDHAERAFLLRKAAISASECDEWSQAEFWFLDAQSAAKLAQDDAMDVFAIGLGADSAVASLKAGNVVRSIKRLANALSDLAEVDPKVTLQATYCHLVIRRTVLWAQTHIERSEANIGGQSFEMEAGSCSNPDPSPAIREHPLAHIDIAWYMLARAETAAGLNAGIADKLGGLLVDGLIPSMEVVLRTNTIQAAIDRLDFVGFAAHFMAYVESAVYVSKKVGKFGATFDPLAPKRGKIPVLDENPPFDPSAEQAARDAIIAFGILSSMNGQHEPLTELENALEHRITGPFPGKPVFDYWNRESGLLTELDHTVVAIAKVLLSNEHVNPCVFWNAGLRFFEWANQSRFKGLLTARLATWQRTGWKRILTKERFRLSRPRQTVPPIAEVLSLPEDDRVFVARLLLATSDAVGSPLRPAYRRSLKAMARDEESDPE